MSNIKPIPIQITLSQPHTHAGVRHAAGATIAVSAADAAWLQANGIGTSLSPDPSPAGGRGEQSEPVKTSRPTTKTSGVKDE